MLSTLQRQARAARRRGCEVKPPEAPPAPVVTAEMDEVRARAPSLVAELERLDASQRQAVLASDSALVRAPVGSGKTTVLVLKLLYLHLVRGVPLRELAVLTFTTRAAREVRDRIAQLTGAPAPADLWLVGTFHGVARALLSRALPVERVGRRPDFAVIDDEEREQLWRRVIERHGLRLRGRRSLRRRMEQLATPAAAGLADQELVRLAALAEEEKRASNVMDFDDLVASASALLPQAPPDAGLPPRWILVDELQDCRPGELDLVRRLRGPETRLFAVGDPLQSIYGWRGSAPEAFNDLAIELGCAVYALPVSYRSTRNVLNAARAVLGLQPVAAGALHGVRDAGEPVLVRRFHDEIAEALAIADRLLALHAQGVTWREMAVLFRLRAQAEPLLRVLREHGIPCEEGPARDQEELAETVRLLTLHAAKGLEFQHVFIAGVNQGVIPLMHGSGDDAEERRLLFVGMTRARDGLQLSHLASPSLPRALGVPSPFMDALPADAVTRHDEQRPATSTPISLSLSLRGRSMPTEQPSTPAVTPTSCPVAAPEAPLTSRAAPAEPPAAALAPGGAQEHGPRWRAGGLVRHRRYGQGCVLSVEADTVEVDFGKMGRRTFPLRLCPLEDV